MDDLTDRAFELVRKPDHVRLALLRGDHVLRGLGFRLIASLLFRVQAYRHDRLGHAADLVAAGGAWDHDVQISRSHLFQRRGETNDRSNHPEGEPQKAEHDDQDDGARNRPHHHREGRNALVAGFLELRILGISLLDDVVDDCAMRTIDGFEILVGLFRCDHVVLGQGRDHFLFGDGPELLYFRVRIEREFALHRGVQVGTGPKIPALVIVLVKLRQPFLVGGNMRRVAKREGGFEISLHDVERRRQNVSNQVVAQLDLRIKRTPDFQLIERVVAGEQHRGEATGRDQAEYNNGAGNGDPNFHR